MKWNAGTWCTSARLEIYMYIYVCTKQDSAKLDPSAAVKSTQLHVETPTDIIISPQEPVGCHFTAFVWNLQKLEIWSNHRTHSMQFAGVSKWNPYWAIEGDENLHWSNRRTILCGSVQMWYMLYSVCFLDCRWPVTRLFVSNYRPYAALMYC